MSNVIPSSDIGKIVELDFGELVDHPLLANIPTWAPDSAEALTLRESIAERGLDYPLLVDTAGRLVDGRNRRHAIQALGGLPRVGPCSHVTAVPCRVVDSHEAASIVVSSLVNRRHLTKGALAYLVLPLLEPAIAEVRARQVANLRRGISRDPIQSDLGKTVAQMGARFGFSADLLEQATRVRALLEKHPELRPDIEAQIVAGELGLGGAIVAITNHLEAADRAEKLGKRAEHDRLFAKNLPKLALHWDKASPEQREHMRTELRTSMLTWPAALVADFAKIARAVERERAQQTATAQA